jgi:hypothetical protein
MTLTPDQDALVQGLLDGSLSPADREAAERLLASSADARQRQADLEDLARLLDALGPAEPPMEFTSHVMEHVRHSAIAAEAVRATAPLGSSRPGAVARLSQLMDGGLGMGKKVMWGLVAAAAIALVVMQFTGFPPLNGAEGTIGAAKRYQAEQITAKDVKVDDSAQAFVQSDAFDHLMKDDNARQLLSSASFRSALASAGFRQALASPDFAKALASTGFRQALASAGFRQALASPDFAKALASAGFQQALASPDFAKALAEPGFAKALADPGFARALASADFARALASPGLAAALASPSFRVALSNPGFVGALGSQQFASALGAVGSDGGR